MKAIVVGAGLTGVTTAWYLARAGWTVEVVERAAEPAAETSHANGGMLTPSQADPWNAPGIGRQVLGWIGDSEAPMLLRPRALPGLLRWGLRFLAESRPDRHRRNATRNAALGLATLDAMADLRVEAGFRYDDSRLGTLKVFGDKASLGASAAMADFLAGLGVPHRVLDRAGVLEVEPALEPVADGLAGGIHYPRDESGDAALFCRELAKAAGDEGVRFRFRSTVRRLLLTGRRVRGVTLDEGGLEAEAVVLCAGSHTPALARPAGLHVPVYPVKGYSITVPADVLGESRRPRVPVVDDRLHACVVPLGERLRVAGTAELTGFEPTVTQARIDNLVRLLAQVYPAATDRLAGVDVAGWTGFRPMSADGVPILGETPVEGLYLNTGHGHLGWTMAAASGQAVAAALTGAESPVPLADYALTRF
jgi:D-amino-acid dehydrogenase